MSWLIDQDPPDAAVHLAWATWRFWWLQGHAGEMARFSKRVLAKSAHLAGHQRALGLAFGAFESLASGDHDQAQALFEQSLPLFRDAGDKLRAAVTASVLGHLLALHTRTPAPATCSTRARPCSGSWTLTSSPGPTASSNC